MDIFRVSFFGHRYINDFNYVEQRLEEIIISLIEQKEYVEFLVGRNGDFDSLVASVIKKIKRNIRNDNNSLCLVLPYMTAEYKNNQKAFDEYYDTVDISFRASTSFPKNAISLRNKEMVDNSDLIIFFVLREKGGAYNSLKYAEKLNKQIVNIAKK